MGFFENIGAEYKHYDGYKRFNEMDAGVMGVTTVDVPGLEPHDIIFQVCIYKNEHIRCCLCELCCFNTACTKLCVTRATHMFSKDNNIIRTFPSCVGSRVYFKQIDKKQ